MSWFNPWGEAARLRRELMSYEVATQQYARRATRSEAENDKLRDQLSDRDAMLRGANNRIAYLETKLAGAVFRDPKTGRLLPKNKVSL